MARAKSVWGIDIGQCALKALKLRDVGGQVQVENFQVIEHPMILSQPDANRPELISAALGEFLDAASVDNSHVVIAVPGQSSFSRFVKLPPVEAKRIPDIVRFEAEQQIPFPMTEVIWRWQTFQDPDSPDMEVGIFAMKRSDVAEMLSHYAGVSLPVDTVQVAPLALYNFMTFDGQVAEEGATLLADVGADKTDLVVADGGRVWTRTIQIGGNNFTEALVRTFKLSFDKAEKLKRTAASSKYARQVFQAMRPVFSDLVQEIQRSVGYYTSLHRESRFKKVVGLGNGFKLPGLQKFIEQNLNIPVSRIDSYNRLQPSESVNAPAMNENVLSFAVAYGLAVQGLGEAEVSTNLLPEEILRQRRWKKKRPWFVAAAIVLLAAMFAPGYRANVDSQKLKDASKLGAARSVIRDLNQRIREYNSVRGEGDQEEQQIKSFVQLFGYRSFWPAMLTMVDRSIESVAPDQPKLAAYGRLLRFRQEFGEQDIRRIRTGEGEALAPDDLQRAGTLLLNAAGESAFGPKVATATPQALRGMARQLLEQAGSTDANVPGDLDEAGLQRLVRRLMLADAIREVEGFKATPRGQREVVMVDRLGARYAASVGGKQGQGRGFQLELTARTPVTQERANKMIADLRRFSEAYARWLSPLAVVSHSVEWLPVEPVRSAVRSADGPVMPDPLMPDESMAVDTGFKVVWTIEIVSDGITMANVAEGGSYKLAGAVDLLPALQPDDPIASAEAIKTLPAGTVLTVEAVETQFSVTWYRVRATDAAGEALGTGYVSGPSLGTQKLEPVTAGT